MEAVEVLDYAIAGCPVRRGGEAGERGVGGCVGRDARPGWDIGRAAIGLI